MGSKHLVEGINLYISVLWLSVCSLLGTFRAAHDTKKVHLHCVPVNKEIIQNLKLEGCEDATDKINS